MQFIKILLTALMLQLLVSLISYSQIWEKTSDRPTNVTDFKIFTFYEPGPKVQCVLSTTGEGLFKSTDYGAFWTNVGLAGLELTGMTSYFLLGDGYPYLVSAENGIHKSTDYGATWTNYTAGIEGLFITDITHEEGSFSPDIYIGTSGHGVYRSQDGGVSWEPFNNGMEDQTVLDIVSDPLDYDLFATTIGGGVWQYDSGNNIWVQKNQGNSTLYNPAIAGDSEGNLYMYSVSYILEANSLNIQWEEEYYHPAGRDIEIANNNEVFAASLGFGVARKDPLGVWADYSDGLPEDNAGFIDVFDIDIDTDGFIWAAVTPLDPTVIGGIFKTIEPVTAVEEVSLEIPNAYTLEQNYPNPFNPGTKISWQSPVGSHQSLKIYDLLGNEVATLVDEYKPAGSYEFNFDATGLTSGIYFYKLQTGEFVETKKMILMK